MSLILDGTNGLSDVDGTAGTPAVRGADTNTGIFFGADIIGFSEGGTECARFNADAQFVAAAGTALLPVITTTGDVNTGIFFPAADTIAFAEGGAEAMRIDSSGNLLVGTTSSWGGSPKMEVRQTTNSAWGLSSYNAGTTTGGALLLRVDSTSLYLAGFYYTGSTLTGTISTNGTNTTYGTSSDYRLKENIAPMTGALAKVAALKPVTYTWKSTGEADQGFIAHELQEVCPSAVTGEKDAVNEDGSIKPQGIDTSFLVATLTAAIQELKAINDAQAQTIESLTARVVALEGQA